MTSKSIKGWLVVAILAIAFITPLVMLIRHTQLYGSAELVAERLADVCRETDSFSVEQFEENLQQPQFEELRKWRDNEIELQPGEIAWFTPNGKYSVGIDDKATVRWIVDGKRTEIR